MAVNKKQALQIISRGCNYSAESLGLHNKNTEKVTQLHVLFTKKTISGTCKEGHLSFLWEAKNGFGLLFKLVRCMITLWWCHEEKNLNSFCLLREHVCGPAASPQCLAFVFNLTWLVVFQSWQVQRSQTTLALAPTPILMRNIFSLFYIFYSFSALSFDLLSVPRCLSSGSPVFAFPLPAAFSLLCHRSCLAVSGRSPNVSL